MYAPDAGGTAALDEGIVSVFVLSLGALVLSAPSPAQDRFPSPFPPRISARRWSTVLPSS